MAAPAQQLTVTRPRLRVLIVLEAAGGGAGRHVLDLAEGLLRRNHNVCLVYSPERAEASFTSRLQSLSGLSLHCLPMRREIGLHDARAARSLRRLIDKIGPFDVAHAHSSKAGALLRLACIGRELPRVYTPHALITLDPGLGPLKRLLYRNAERALSRFGDDIICVSDQELEHAQRVGLHADCLSVVHNGIAPAPARDRIAIRAELGISPATVCIGTVGRLSRQKAVSRLIDAYAVSGSAARDTRLVIVGDGPERDELAERVRSQGLDRRVVFTGATDGARLMAAFDIFALASRYEGFPYVLLEAAACGLPIVMTETGGAHAIVRDGYNGFIVPQFSTEVFAARLRELVSKPDLRETLGIGSLELADEFSLDAMVEQTLAVYDRCMQRHTEAAL